MTFVLKQHFTRLGGVLQITILPADVVRASSSDHSSSRQRRQRRSVSMAPWGPEIQELPRASETLPQQPNNATIREVGKHMVDIPWILNSVIFLPALRLRKGKVKSALPLLLGDVADVAFAGSGDGAVRLFPGVSTEGHLRIILSDQWQESSYDYPIIFVLPRILAILQ